MILSKHDLEDDWNAVDDEEEAPPTNWCEWCGQDITEDDRFCPATDCQREYMEECGDD